MREKVWRWLNELSAKKLFFIELRRHVDYISKNPMPGSHLAAYLEENKVLPSMRNILIEAHRKAIKVAKEASK